MQGLDITYFPFYTVSRMSRFPTKEERDFLLSYGITEPSIATKPGSVLIGTRKRIKDRSLDMDSRKQALINALNEILNAYYKNVEVIKIPKIGIVGDVNDISS